MEKAAERGCREGLQRGLQRGVAERGCREGLQRGAAERGCTNYSSFILTRTPPMTYSLEVAHPPHFCENAVFHILVSASPWGKVDL
jgi:hypothetical protein